MNVFLLFYLIGVILTCAFLFWLVQDNDLESHKMYLVLAVSWIISVPLFLVLCLIALIFVGSKE